MTPEMKKMAPGRKMAGGQPTPKPMAEQDRIVAPLRGLTLNDSLFSPTPGGALVLDNWIVGLSSVRPRNGYQKYATIAADAVQSMFTYKTGSAEEFFAASDDSIFDITSIADPEVIPTAAVTGQTSGLWLTEQFGTAGGDFLYCVNGVDSPQLYDGSAWTTITGASSPAITGVTTSNLSHVWSFASRLFFVEKDTMKAWYLPVDSIGGAAAEFSLAGIFKKGGSLLFGATWSLDSGDGPNEQCVFVSTEGEVAVYRGINPGSASEWTKIGVYEIADPMGARATIKAGGDLLIATEAGLIPLSVALQRDLAAQLEAAASREIRPLWTDNALKYGNVPWQAVKWPEEDILMVTQPDSGTVLLANMQSLAWSRFTGVDAQCLAVFGGGCYFGDALGVIYRLQAGGSDDGAAYTAKYLGQFEDLNAPGSQKTVLQARPSFISKTPIAPQFNMKADYKQNLSPAPNAAAFTATEGWDASTWDVSLWDALGAEGVDAADARWVSVGVTGYTHAAEVQVTFGSPLAPDVEYVGADITISRGALVA